MKHHFKNKYGSLTIDTVAAYQPVSTISSKNVAAELFFSIDDAEKIVLITENRRIQVAFAPGDLSRAYLIHHESASMAALCKVEALDFDPTINAQQAIEDEARTAPAIH